MINESNVRETPAIRGLGRCIAFARTHPPMQPGVRASMQAWMQVLLLTFGAAMATTANAQDVAIDWAATCSGGGLTAGGEFELVSAIARHDAGATSGGGFELFGGASLAPPPSAALPCPGDTNGDLVVDFSDLGNLLANYGATSATREQGDLDGDADVDLADLGQLLVAYGTSCEP